MRIRDEILNNTFPLNEMAAAELAKVLDLIKAGDLKGAAAKYIEVGGNPSSSGVGKTVNSYITKHTELSPQEKQHFESFKSAVEEIKGEKGIKSNRPAEYKTGVTGVTRKGEEVTVKGLSQQARKENVLKVIDKQKIEIDKERAMLDAGTDENGLRKMAMEFVKDMKYTDLTDEDKNFIATLKDFSATGNNKEKAVDIMHTLVDEGEKVMVALKKRVAAGAMVKPSEQKMLGQMEKYKKIDVLKGQKELEAKSQKQIEQKSEVPANEDTLYEDVGHAVLAIAPAIIALAGAWGFRLFISKTELGKRFMDWLNKKGEYNYYAKQVKGTAFVAAEKRNIDPRPLVEFGKRDPKIKVLLQKIVKANDTTLDRYETLDQIFNIMYRKAKEIQKQTLKNESFATSNKRYLETSAKIAFKEGFMK